MYRNSVIAGGASLMVTGLLVWGSVELLNDSIEYTAQQQDLYNGSVISTAIRERELADLPGDIGSACFDLIEPYMDGRLLEDTVQTDVIEDIIDTGGDACGDNRMEIRSSVATAFQRQDAVSDAKEEEEIRLWYLQGSRSSESGMTGVVVTVSTLGLLATGAIVYLVSYSNNSRRDTNREPAHSTYR